MAAIFILGTTDNKKGIHRMRTVSGRYCDPVDSVTDQKPVTPDRVCGDQTNSLS